MVFGSAKITQNADTDKYFYSRYGIRFDFQSLFSIPHFDSGKNIYVLGVDMSSSVHIDNKRKYILILSKRPTQGLNSTTLTAEATYSINFFQITKKILFKFSL